MMRERLNKLASRLPKWKRIHNRMMMSISAQIAKLIDEKFKTRKEFADLIGKQESEISKLLSGTHNFTLKSLAKIEDKLGEQFLFTKDEFENKLSLYKEFIHNYYTEFNPITLKSTQSAKFFKNTKFVNVTIKTSKLRKYEIWSPISPVSSKSNKCFKNILHESPASKTLSNEKIFDGPLC